jgi:hypothetical protein
VWAGPVSGDPHHRQGFEASAFMRVEITSVSRRAIALTLDVPQHGTDLAFAPIRHTADDVLGDLRIEGEPLRTFMGYVRGPGNTGESFLTFVSLFPEDRVDVRVIRGPDETYGVFSLRPVREDRGGIDAAPRD